MDSTLQNVYHIRNDQDRYNCKECSQHKKTTGTNSSKPKELDHMTSRTDSTEYDRSYEPIERFHDQHDSNNSDSCSKCSCAKCCTYRMIKKHNKKHNMPMGVMSNVCVIAGFGVLSLIAVSGFSKLHFDAVQTQYILQSLVNSQ